VIYVSFYIQKASKKYTIITFVTRTLKIPLSYIVMLHIYTFYRSIYLYSMSYFFISISIIQ